MLCISVPPTAKLGDGILSDGENDEHKLAGGDVATLKIEAF